MNIKGPGGPSGGSGVGPTDADSADGVDKTKSTAGADSAFAAKLASPEAPAAAAGASKNEAIAKIAAELQAGTIDAQQAVTRLLDVTVGASAAHLPPSVQDSLKRELAALLQTDPLLVEKAGRAGLAAPAGGQKLDDE